jgi:cobalamin 5'-phosphate synthase/cobalamin synthase
VKTLATAVALLTRIPVPAAADAETAGHATRWFPLVGASLGGLYAGLAWLAGPHLPAAVIGVLVVVAEALLTGALHMDGLADTADGFGGGKTREDILRIMSEPTIGSYGAAALVLLVAFKAAAIAGLIERHTAMPNLILVPALARWTVAPLARFLPYARPAKSAPATFVGTPELIWATVLALLIAAATGMRRGFLCWAAVAAATAAFGAYSNRKIGGITGDVLGAAIEIAECTALLLSLLV